MKTQDQHKHFDEVAHAYDDAIPKHVRDHYLKRRVNFLRSVASGGTLLDVGCGTGLLIEEMAPHGYEVAGVDASPGMLEIMRERVPLPAVCADSTRLPFENDTFDTVLCVAVLHHVADHDAVATTIREMTRVSKAGGRVVIIDHNPANPYWPHLMRRMPQDDGSERLVPLREILDALDSANSRPTFVRQTGFMPEFTPLGLLPVLARLERLAEATPLSRIASHNMVVARRV
jgi:ubiquinone/menaquinone biosynthesis C-methylase UbiE